MANLKFDKPSKTLIIHIPKQHQMRDHSHPVLFSSYSISSIFNFPFRFSHLFLILKKSVIHFQLLLNLAVMNLSSFSHPVT